MIWGQNNPMNAHVVDESFDCWLKPHTNFLKKYFSPYLILVAVCSVWVHYEPHSGIVGAVKYNKEAKPHTFVSIKWILLFIVLGCITIPVAIILERILSPPVVSMGQHFVRAAIIAPIVEENCKFFTIFWLFSKNLDSCKIARNPASVIVYSVVAAQVFGMIENYVYANQWYHIHPSKLVSIVIMRLLFPFHTMFGMLHATKLSHFTKFDKVWIRSEGLFPKSRKSTMCQILSQYFKVMWLPVLFHASWNGCAVLARYGAPLFAILSMIIIIGVGLYYPLRLYHKYFHMWGKFPKRTCNEKSYACTKRSTGTNK